MIECDSFCGHYYWEGGGCNPTCVYIYINFIYIWISLLQLDYLSTCWYNAFITWVKSSPRWHSFTCCVGKLRYGFPADGSSFATLKSIEQKCRRRPPKNEKSLRWYPYYATWWPFSMWYLWYWIYFPFDEIYLVSRNFMCLTHSIHETGIFTYIYHRKQAFM